jgi:hypothetical protein
MQSTGSGLFDKPQRKRCEVGLGERCGAKKWKGKKIIWAGSEIEERSGGNAQRLCDGRGEVPDASITFVTSQLLRR